MPLRADERLHAVAAVVRRIAGNVNMMPSTPDPSWAPGPREPLLPKGEVHVWRADLTAGPGHLVGLLCAEERERAERFLSDGDRQRWMGSRGVLRALLGGYLQKDPRTLRFTISAHGKPVLREDAAGSSAPPVSVSARHARISFNLSHSGQLALYAFIETGSVGVDVEVAGRRGDEVAIAARVLGLTEARRLEGLDQPIREREFLRAWVRHEAVLKCRGTGIGGADGAPSGVARWVAELDVGVRAAAAVALERPPHDLRCWDWHSEPAASSG
jgi:4'-phosphopantetheinyl transferase